jgi:hypothetical protein
MPIVKITGMKKLLIFTLWLMVRFSQPLWAQDAHSMAIGGATTSAPMDVFGMIWNPALIALPGNTTFWTLATGLSAFDTSNTNTPILRLNQGTALQSGADPVNRYQDYEGLFNVRYTTAAGGVLFDQSLTTQASHSAFQLFNDLSAGPVTGTYNNLNFLETRQQIASLILSYGQPLPFGTMPVYVGGSLKYQDGLQYSQDNLTGTYTYTQGVTTTYQYTRTTSSNGLGLSIDAGFLAQLTDFIQMGMMFENIQSNFSWTATQQTLNFGQSGPATVAPNSTLTNQTVTANLSYITRLGISISPQGKNVCLSGEVEWGPDQTNWKFGLERYYPESNMVVRLGTFYDNISQSQLWCFGWGIFTKVFTLDMAFETRSLPSIQDSIAVGGALDAEVRF